MIERIILHAGTPKTGTTSLQIALDRCRADLAGRGFLYPKAIETSYPRADGQLGTKPKHQWLVADLMADDDAAFFEHLGAAIAEASSGVHTLILSTEGLFHHWWDFSSTGRAALATLKRSFRVELWVWFRDPVEFFVSNYIQMLKNPRSPVVCYGQDWSTATMLDDPWFVRRLDYAGFVDEAGAVLGEDAVRAFVYRGRTVADFLAAAGLADIDIPEPREHSTLGQIGVDLLRVLNGRELSSEAKMAAVNAISRLDAELGACSEAFQLDAATIARVRTLAQPGLSRLRRERALELGPVEKALLL